MKRDLSLILLSILLFGCGSLKTNSSGTVQELAVNKDAAQSSEFRIFDQNFNFIKTYNVSDFQYARGRFRVHSEEASQVAVIGPNELLAARIDLLNQAKSSVRIQAFLFHGDETGWLIADKLIELRKRGVDVKVIVDGVANISFASQRLYFELQQNGIQVMGYEPAYLFFLEEFAIFETTLAKLNKLHLRFHEKLFVIDAEDPERTRAIVGGTNIGNQYFRVDGTKELSLWTDLDIMIKGDAASDAASLFDENYAEFSANKKEYARLNLDEIWNAALRWSQNQGREKLLNLEKPDFNSKIMENIEAKIAQGYEPQWTNSKIRLMRNRPRKTEYYIGDALVSMLEDAQREVLIANAFFIPDQIQIEAIIAAAKRGVNIKILTNSLRSAPSELMVLASRSTYAKLLSAETEGKISIYEWLGKDAKDEEEGVFHAKYSVYDGEASVVGSFNLDPRSHLYHSESVSFSESQIQAQRLREYFNVQSGAKLSREITLEEAKSFDQSESLIERIKRRFALSIMFLL